MDPGKLTPVGLTDAPVILTAVKFAQLPHPKTGIMNYFISDGAAAKGSATVGTAAAGGGSNVVPVYSDGSIWRYG